jgi:hypothetical protein
MNLKLSVIQSPVQVDRHTIKGELGGLPITVTRRLTDFTVFLRIVWGEPGQESVMHDSPFTTAEKKEWMDLEYKAFRLRSDNTEARKQAMRQAAIDTGLFPA